MEIHLINFKNIQINLKLLYFLIYRITLIYFLISLYLLKIYLISNF